MTKWRPFGDRSGIFCVMHTQSRRDMLPRLVSCYGIYVISILDSFASNGSNFKPFIA